MQKLITKHPKNHIKMSKLKTSQKEILDRITSDKIRKKLKKAFKKENKKQSFEDTRSFLENYFATITYPVWQNFDTTADPDKNEFTGVLSSIIEAMESESGWGKNPLSQDEPEQLKSSRFNNTIKQETEQTFTKEDMEKCFNESRLTTHPLTASFKHENLASYLKTLSDEK